MDRLYKLLCVWMVVSMTLLGLAPAVSGEGPSGPASGPDGLAGRSFVPPRPDLMAKMQQASLGRRGFALDAALGPREAGLAFRRYLAQKLDPKLQGDSITGSSQKGGTRLAQTPPDKRVLVALVDYNDLANRHDNIPKPSTENNTDYWVEDFDQAHYQTMLFSETNMWSMRRYFREASDWGGASGWDLLGDVHDWDLVPGDADEYGDDSLFGGLDNDTADGYTLTDLVQDAADTLIGWSPTAPITWTDYTTGGVIDYFIVVHAGKGQEAGGGTLGDDAVWSTRGSLTTTYQISGTSTYVQDYVVVSEDAPVGVFVHEMGHLFGLPDTWNPLSAVDEMAWPGQDLGGAGEASPSFYDPMAQGCWLGRPLGTRPASMTAWERIELDWLTPAVWNLSMLPASIYLAQLESPSPSNKALKVELPARTYVSPHSLSWMRQAPDPANLTSPSLLTHTLEITGSFSAEFKFWHWYDLEANYDYGYFEIDSGSGYSPVYTYTGNSGGWIQQTVDLTPYLGQNIDIRFNLVRDSTRDGLGWFLDDFELWQNGVLTWNDDVETSAAGPPQGSSPPSYTWLDTRFPRMGAYTSDHYYLAEWRNDASPLAGFDVGLQEAYNMTDMLTGKAEYFRYNPGMLVWYANPIYLRGDNDVIFHPGEGFLLAIDAHPEPLLEASTVTPWRTRVQMQDATFREPGKFTYQNTLTDGGGAPNVIGPLPAASYFWDKWSSYPYWDPTAPDNSVKTLQYGAKLEVEGENPDTTGATIRFSIDAGDMRDSTKSVDKATATPGEVLEYTIVLHNNGIADAHTIVVSDTEPAHTTYISGTVTVTGSPTTTVLNQNNGIYWMGTVPLGSPVTITFQVVLDAVIADGTVVQNVAHVYEGTVPEVDLYAETTIESAPCLISSTKSADPTTALAGDLVTYTIALENTGNMDATATVTDCIPDCSSYVTGSLSSSTGSGYYDSVTDCVYWTGFVPAQVGPSAWITFQIQIDPGQVYCSRISNRAALDDGYRLDEIWADTTVIQGPNLWESTKTVDKSVAAPGEVLEYTIYVFNGGNQSASVSIADLIPANTSYVTDSLSYTGGSGSCDGTTMTWVGTVGVVSSETIAFSVAITSPLANGTIITNTAPIVENGIKTYTRTVTTTVLAAPRLTNSTKEVTSNSVGYGGILTYTITLVNDGTQGSTVYLTDTIPSGTQYRPGTVDWTPGIGTGSYVTGTNQVYWNGTITASTSVTVTFEVSITIATTGIITNAALIDDTFNDPFYIFATTYVAGLEAVGPTQDVYCGDQVRVPIRVTNVADLQGFQATVDFDPSILQVESIQQGTWFAPAAWTVKTYNNITGTSTVAATLLSQPSGLWGSGVLYDLVFRTVGDGTSPITITQSLLSNTPAPSFTPIPHNTINTTVTVLVRSVVGRAFLQGRTDHSTAELVYSDQVLATTASDGSFSFCPPVGYGDNFLLRGRKNGYLFTEKLIAVTMTGTITLNDVTLLGGDPIGPQDMVTTPLTCTTPITIPVPVAGPPDGRVNVLDLTFVGARFLKTSADPDWGPDVCEPDYVAYKADINEDSVVNIYDLVLVGNNFGTIAPTFWP